MSIFDLTPDVLRERGAAWITREIRQQPRIWRELGAQHLRDQAAIDEFLTPLLGKRDLRIILTGAGTSALVGECLSSALARRTRRRVEAIATTDLLAAPGAWLEPATPTLLISFARSGNSPESVAVVELAGRCIRDCAQLVITCNRDGALHQHARTQPRACCILLPDAANDRSFAMTSSFTGMLLAAALAFGLLAPERVGDIAELGTEVLCAWVPRLEGLVAGGFERAVYLGSNTFKGLAREAALKMLELSDGRVMALGETPLGLRHGPKTILNRSTVVLAFVSADPYTRRYDLDLLAELRREGTARQVLSVSAATPESQAAAGGSPDDLLLTHPRRARCDDLALCLPFAVLAQSLALLRSLACGLEPDRPNAAGTVNRVVQGVTIHPYEPTAG